MKVIFLRLAGEDVRHAYEWYELKQPGLGSDLSGSWCNLLRGLREVLPNTGDVFPVFDEYN